MEKGVHECTIPPHMRIQPGEVRNPTGSQTIPMTKEVRDAFRARTLDALSILVEIMMDRRAKGQDRVRAAEAVLDRGWGRPKESIDIDLQTNIPIVFSELLKNEADRKTAIGSESFN